MMMVKGATEETFRVPLLDLIDHLFLTFSLVPSGKASVGVPEMLPAFTTVNDPTADGFAM